MTQDLKFIHVAGVAMKRHNLKAGESVQKHSHDYDHVSILAKGIAAVTLNDAATIMVAGEELLVKAGESHNIEAITEVTWFCIHPDTVSESKDDEA
jgi:quercetin dioxygenase-like cupin family protein